MPPSARESAAGSEVALQGYAVPGRQRVQLTYIPQYRVLLCAPCGYCVLPRAIDRHLKVIHHIPAADRKRHLESLRDCDLADWEDITFPSAGSEPVRGLPVYQGYACAVDGCDYLSVTNKRMQAHWRTQHPDIAPLRCRRARLQTLFRGNNLRYFIVSNPTPTPSTRSSSRTPEDNGAIHTMQLTSDANDAVVLAPRFDVLPFDSTVTTQPPGYALQALLSVTANEQPLVPPEPAVVENRMETAIEWLLTHQFCEDSFAPLQPTAGSAPSWRDEMLQACYEVDFLRFAVLSLAANHIAFSHPDSRELYSQEASRFRDLALQTLTSRVSAVTPENFFSVFNFTRLMTLCCLAAIQITKMTMGEAASTAESMIPPWFPVQLEGKKLIWPLRGGGRIIRAMHGPWESLATSNAMPNHDISNNPLDDKLADLATALKALPAALVDESCLEALDNLRRVWATPYRDAGNGFRDVALMWPVRIPQRYLDLVEAHDTIALIVFAHYWVLWAQSEGYYWYMKGHAETMMGRIVQRLPAEWLDWIEWPVSMVLGPDFLPQTSLWDDLPVDVPEDAGPRFSSILPAEGGVVGEG